MNRGGGNVASPCNSVCTIDAGSGLCAGCYRTLEEIASWIDLSEGERRALLAVLDQRRERHRAETAVPNAANAQR